MGRVRKSLQDKIADGVRPARMTTMKKFEINQGPDVALSVAEMKIYTEVVNHLNECGAGMNIDNRLICAYVKDVLMIDALQEQLKKAIVSTDEDSGAEVKRLNSAVSGTHQRIFQNQQSLGIGSLNRRKIAHFQDHIDHIIEEKANEDPYAALLKVN
jgi:hypothetical protein